MYDITTLCSPNVDLLVIPRVSKSRVENFSYLGSLLWNQLPVWVSPKPLKLGLKPYSKGWFR